MAFGGGFPRIASTAAVSRSSASTVPSAWMSLTVKGYSPSFLSTGATVDVEPSVATTSPASAAKPRIAKSIPGRAEPAWYSISPRNTSDSRGSWRRGGRTGRGRAVAARSRREGFLSVRQEPFRLPIDRLRLDVVDRARLPVSPEPARHLAGACGRERGRPGPSRENPRDAPVLRFRRAGGGPEAAP